MTGGELAGILIGATLLVLGCASALASMLRPRRGTRIFLAFGLSAGLYGARLLALQAPVRATLGEWFPWRYFIAFVTYVINVPLTYFVEGIIGPGWRHSTRWVSRAVIAFAIVAILIDLALARPGAAIAANSWLVLILHLLRALETVFHASTIGSCAHRLDRPDRGARRRVFAVFVVNENLGQPVLPGTNVEPIGMLFFVLCLGYAVVRSVFRAETEFAGVQRELETARRIQMSLLPRQDPKHSDSTSLSGSCQ